MTPAPTLKPWLTRAHALLLASLGPPRNELNELDWKSDLSPDKKRLAQHLSAFGNHIGGGFLVFGIQSDGTAAGVSQLEVDVIIGQLGNLGRDAVEPPLALDHGVLDYQGVDLLFIRVPESATKPVHIRGKGIENAYIRSGGTTRAASRQDIGTLMLYSRTPKWEELRASVLREDEELLASLEIEPILTLLDRPKPTSAEETLAWMADEGFVSRVPTGGGFVTNLGAIAAAGELNAFPDLARKAVRVIEYAGTNKGVTKREREGIKGYAIGFQNLLDYVKSITPTQEFIEGGLRSSRDLYPEIALREIIANSLIHQDFSIEGTGPMIEIFMDRIEISNPGVLLPSKRLDRLIGTQPESRNERLARAFRRYRICEERGSGLLKAGIAVERAALPPLQFETGDNHFKVTLFGPRTYAEMTPRERLAACYQHAIIRHFSGETLTNQSLRARLRMPEKRRSMVSVLIQQAVDEQMIKPADPENLSKKHAEYVPSWA